MRLPDGAKSRAVLIGTAAFDRLPGVPHTSNNLAAMRDALVRHTGLPREHCARVEDERDLAAIGGAVQAAVKGADDLLLVYYSGHGLVDSNGELFLTQPQSSAELLQWSAIPYAALERQIRYARAAVKVIILDCCYSGRAIGGMSDEDGGILGKIQVTGSFTLTSSPANAESLAPEGSRHTAFTGALLEVLEEGSEDAGEFLALRDVYRELLRRSRANGMPEPQLCVTHTAERLSLARNRYRPEPVEPPRVEVPAPAQRQTPPEEHRSVPRASPWHRMKAEWEWPPVEPILTADEVHEVRFTTVRLSEGYDENEVDAFLDQVALALSVREAGTQRMTVEDVRNAQFATTRLREGYDMDEVDNFLDQIELELERRSALRENSRA